MLRPRNLSVRPTRAELHVLSQVVSLLPCDAGGRSGQETALRIHLQDRRDSVRPSLMTDCLDQYDSLQETSAPQQHSVTMRSECAAGRSVCRPALDACSHSDLI